VVTFVEKNETQIENEASAAGYRWSNRERGQNGRETTAYILPAEKTAPNKFA